MLTWVKLQILGQVYLDEGGFDERLDLTRNVPPECPQFPFSGEFDLLPETFQGKEPYTDKMTLRCACGVCDALSQVLVFMLGCGHRQTCESSLDQPVQPAELVPHSCHISSSC